MIDSYAKDYVEAPPEKQAEFLDNAIVGFTHLIEDIGQQKSGLPDSDSDRLAAIKAQAKHDEEKFREASIGLEFMSYDYPHYDQLYPPYDPQVSILDLLFMQGPEAARLIWAQTM